MEANNEKHCPLLAKQNNACCRKDSCAWYISLYNRQRAINKCAITVLAETLLTFVEIEHPL